MENYAIYAGIVTYNPEIHRLRENIEAILPQVEEIVVFDNGSKNIGDFINLPYENIKIIQSKENKGIAFALNRLMEYGYDHKYPWMISLDQDSVCPCNYVDNISKYLDVEKKLGVIAPVIKDSSLGIVGHHPINSYQKVNTCITSGAVNSISAWKKCGGFDDYLFIDSVDFDYCRTLREKGYSIIQVRDVVLQHKLGESQNRLFLFFKVRVYNHSEKRKYYIARNNVYYPKKHKLWLHFVRGNIRNLKLLCIVMMYEKKKMIKMKSIVKGWGAGLTAKCIIRDCTTV